MPVTTRSQQSRSLLYPHAIDESEGGPSEDRLSRTMQEWDSDDDPIDGSLTGLSSSEDEEHKSVLDESEFDDSEKSNHEESDDFEFDGNFEGPLNAIQKLHVMLTGWVHSKASYGKAP